MNRTLRLIIVVASMSVFLVSMIVDHQIRRQSGTEVILDLEPVDPRDLLAGYYVIIQTPLHILDANALAGDDEFRPGNDIFVVLEPGADGDWHPTSIYHARPDDGIFIHGKVRRSWDETIFAHFNLERYYAHEETAQILEHRRRGNRDRLRWIVSVESDGRAIIRGLEINGERQIDFFL
ncbi:MAG: hypothetical protein DHS20C06_11230 [Hyphobacterium sp.]|nr:MAG: hypothetical protein DHS20C06_11230 [Hyphobacterium sp.]